MSRETTFKDGAWVGGYEYSSATQLTEDIAKCEAEISDLKAQIYGLVCATPKDITPALEDPKTYISVAFDELMDDLQEAVIRLADMYIIELNKEHISG